MKIKTITTVDGINPVYFGDYAPRFYWFKNLGDSTLYISSKPNIVIGADDVAELLPGTATSIETDEGKVYIFGAGKVEIHNVDNKFCPFRLSSSGGSGGVEDSEIITYALNDAGYDVTDDPSTWGSAVKTKFLSYDYRLDYSGLIFRYDSRTITRDTDKLAYCGWWHYDTSNWFCPIIIATDPEATRYNMSGYVSASEGSFMGDDGNPVYYNATSNGSIPGVEDSSEYNRRYLGRVGAYATVDEDVAKKLYNEIKILGYSLYE